jgi:hypothetical protein
VKRVFLVAGVRALIGAVVGFVTGLAGLWDGPLYGAIILACVGFVGGLIGQSFRRHFPK